MNVGLVRLIEEGRRTIDREVVGWHRRPAVTTLPKVLGSASVRTNGVTVHDTTNRGGTTRATEVRSCTWSSMARGSSVRGSHTNWSRTATTCSSSTRVGRTSTFPVGRARHDRPEGTGALTEATTIGWTNPAERSLGAVRSPVSVGSSSGWDRSRPRYGESARTGQTVQEGFGRRDPERSPDGGYVDGTTVVRNVPTPSYVISTVSPGSTTPGFAGLPNAITSPGRRVNRFER